jgi:predicted enzyme related to lactoylglutathione lyase
VSAGTPGISHESSPVIGSPVVELRFLYVGSADVERDLPIWLALPGATMRWRFQAFDADVAAVELVGGGPLVLLADHRPAGTLLPIFAVDELGEAVDGLGEQGWQVVARWAGTPEGPAAELRDPSGNEIALLRVDRPGAMDAAYADPGNRHAVRAARQPRGTGGLPPPPRTS